MHNPLQAFLSLGSVVLSITGREHIFALMMRNSESAMEFCKLPANRVVELGSRVEI